jgi:hypothetical protein
MGRAAARAAIGARLAGPSEPRLGIDSSAASAASFGFDVARAAALPDAFAAGFFAAAAFAAAFDSVAGGCPAAGAFFARGVLG